MISFESLWRIRVTGGDCSNDRSPLNNQTKTDFNRVKSYNDDDDNIQSSENQLLLKHSVVR